MTTEFDFSGVWIADDGAHYYVRQLGDSIWWAGLHDSGFHAGVIFTNLFRGRVFASDRTIVGSWADVPRGSTYGHGKLTLEIVEPERERGLELRKVVEHTTGSFGASVWSRWNYDTPIGIREKFAVVRRYDGAFHESNAPVRDFVVASGKIQAADPPHLSWDDVIPREYFLFRRGDDYTNHLDGDLNFNIDNVYLDPQFWEPSDEWLMPYDYGHVDFESADELLRYWLGKGGYFHCEGVMFGRTNDADDPGPPNVLLPGWNEAGGDSILLNSRPVSGGVFHWGNQVFVGDTKLVPGMRVRVTGVVNFDDHDSPPLELHPVYSIDVLQDFCDPRPDVTLTGVWNSNDVGQGTYYVRQLADDTVWWLGLSHDQGRSFANVFQGKIRYADNEGVPLQTPVLAGEWVDVPIGFDGASSNGRVELTGDAGSQIASATILTTVERSFGASCLTKLFDSVPEHRASVRVFSGALDVTSGQTLRIDKSDLDDGTFGQGYRLVMANLVPPVAIEWSAQGVVSNPHDAATDVLFSGLDKGGTRGVAVRVTDSTDQAFSLRFRVNFIIASRSGSRWRTVRSRR